MTTIILPAKEKQFIQDILVKEGIGDHDANTVAAVLVSADVRGIKSHGLSRLKKYLDRINQGLIDRKPKLTVVSEKRNILLLDGHNSLGQITAVEAMSKAIDLAKEYGTSVVATGNSNHFGIAAYYSMMASTEGMIGFVCTNTSPLMAPFGGKKAMLGTNPFTVAIPANRHHDIVLDLATSQVARGKIEVAAREGQEIPYGWAVDAEGRPTTDANEGLKGTVTPLGGPKGYGMSLVIDILSGVLTRSDYLEDIGSLSATNKKQNLGYFMVVIDPAIFVETNIFTKIIDDYIERIKTSPKAEGVTEIFLPGEIEAIMTEKQEKEGISIAEGLYEAMKDLGKSYQLNFDDYLQK